MENFDANKVLHESNELIKEIVEWIKIRNTRELYTIEAVAITDNGSYYSISYMCFGWEKRHPEMKDKSIWKWWRDEKIKIKFKFKNETESTNPKKVFKIVQKIIFNLQKKIKDEQVKQKLRVIEHVFD